MLIYYPPDRMSLREALCHDYFSDLDKSTLPPLPDMKPDLAINEFYKIALNSLFET